MNTGFRGSQINGKLWRGGMDEVLTEHLVSELGLGCVVWTSAAVGDGGYVQRWLLVHLHPTLAGHSAVLSRCWEGGGADFAALGVAANSPSHAAYHGTSRPAGWPFG